MITITLEHIITQIVAFLLMLWVLKRFAWKPLLEILHQRTEKIRAELAAIEQSKEDVRELAEKYALKIQGSEEEGRAIIREATRESRAIAQTIQDKAHQQAKDILKQAHEASQMELVKAKVELKNEIIHLSTTLFEKLVREKLTPEGNEALIASLMNEIKSS